MTKQISGIRLSINEPREKLLTLVAKELDINPREISNLEIVKESIDARRKDKIDFVYTVKVKLEGTKKEEEKKLILQKGSIPLSYRPVIVGSGPGGLMASLFLSREGYCPIILERGKDVHQRSKDVEGFWQDSILDPDSNIQFGEGGAGTFSDGKLTTRINSPWSAFLIQELIEGGAPPEIKYSHKPHVGTDILRNVVKNIREKIIGYGGEFRFSHKVTDLVISKGKVIGIIVNDKEELPCDSLLLAIGHSGRDTYEMLLKRGFAIKPKPFSIGVRIEHFQNLIDKIQYGKYAGHPRLGAADYQLVYKNQNRATYTFCMCPGGVVVGAASEPGRVVTNGMSYHTRDGKNANSAVVVSVDPQDFPGSSPLSGIEFQRFWEEKAYNLGGGNFIAPCQYLSDFLGVKRGEKVTPTYRPGVAERDMTLCLPPYVTQMLKDGLKYFDRKMPGFAGGGSLITGIETRTSAPVRIIRNENYTAVGFENVFLIGEGAGYAGGIVSSGVDGIKAAVEFMKIYKPIV